MPVVARPKVRFGTLELDTRAGELFKHGLKLKLQGHPIQILAMLLERPGDLITREEIQQRLWPSESETFVDFEHGLNNAMRKLRQALGDEAETPIYIETLPRRGYRFIGQIEPEEVSEPRLEQPFTAAPEITGEPIPTGAASAAETKPWASRRLWVALSLLGFIALGSAALLYSRGHRVPALTEKDTIVVADFANTTGDTVFIDTLRQGLLVELSQSPYLNILSDDQVRTTLRQMGRQPQEWLSEPLAREVCVRSQSKVFISGSIASLGSEYVLGLKAENCFTGAVIAQQQTEIARKEDVLYTLGKQATKLRGKLGESLASIQKFDVPLEQASTSSLEALQAYSLGLKQQLQFKFQSAAPLYEHAIELDPNFAMAYARLARVDEYLQKWKLAKENYNKAFSLRKNVTERERLYIESVYYNRNGELEKAAQILELWKGLYPQDSAPYLMLAVVYQVLGQYDKDYAAIREAFQRDPNPLTRWNMVVTYVERNQLEEAEKLRPEAEAEARRLGSQELKFLPVYYYKSAFLRHDSLGMERAVNAAPAGFLAYWQLAAETYYGRFRKSHDLLTRAVEAAQREDDYECASELLAQAAAREAVVGNAAQARRFAMESLSQGKSQYAMTLAAVAYAQSGELSRAEKLAEELDKRYQADTLLQAYWLPSIRAFIEISRNNPARAVEVLGVTAPYELASPGILFGPVYARGEAYLLLHRGSDAVAEFQKIVDHPGIDIDPIGALAFLGLARGYAVEGDTPKARAAYEHFLTLWKNADPDIPIYRQAKAEYAKLQ
jgi:eukaryotic-like serine/threonine-protein kinase